MDSAGEDCSTGIILAGFEFTDNSAIFIADLTQSTFTPGSPGIAGTWTGASQIQILDGSSLEYGPCGIAIAQGTHTGILSGEFGGNQITAILLPSTSGSGIPAIVDWVSCAISYDWSNGRDPHTITAYQSPNSKDAIALLANDQATAIAVVDLTMMLNTAIVPRTGNVCTDGVLPASVVSFITVV